MTKKPQTPLLVPPFTNLYNSPIPELWLAALMRRPILGDTPIYDLSPLVYEMVGVVKNVSIKGQPRVTLQTRADGGPNGFSMQTWADEVRSQFAQCGIAVSQPEAFAAAIADELLTRTESSSQKRSVKAAIPVTPITAVLQNQTGVLGTARENDYGDAVERIYAIGRHLSGDPIDSGAGSRLQDALVARMAIDSRMRAVDAAQIAALSNALGLPVADVQYDQLLGQVHFSGSTASRGFEPLDHDQLSVVDKLGRLGGSTSFVWFYESWRKLTDPTWSRMVPHRRWIDWLVSVTRLAIGSSYLFREQWVIRASRLVLDNSVSELEIGAQLASECATQPLIQWVDRSQNSLAQRDVFPEIRSIICTGVSLRKLIADEPFKSVLDGEITVEKLLKVVRQDSQLSEELLKTYTSPTLDFRKKLVQPVYNTVRDALIDRTGTKDTTSGNSDDFYALMQTRNNITVIDPSSEAVALLATLACHEPNGTTNLGDVKRQFQKVGLQPSQTEVRYLLERAGLCRAEADASLQVSVSSALRVETLL
jgi:hypothetical protein